METLRRGTGGGMGLTSQLAEEVLHIHTSSHPRHRPLSWLTGLQLQREKERQRLTETACVILHMHILQCFRLLV